MANDVAGTDWTDAENDLIVADYFSMLSDEIAGRSFVKAHHNAALQQLTGRSRKSIEYKHMNISAVMGRLGMPHVRGYRPYPHFQNGLIAAVDRYLDRHELLKPDLGQVPAKAFSDVRTEWRGPSLSDSFIEAKFIPLNSYEPPPESDPRTSKTTDALERLVRKFDPAARDARNRILGRQGEQLIFESERKQLLLCDREDLARQVEWTSQERGDGAGYDIASFAADGSERLIEVKTTKGAAQTPFFLSENERLMSEECPKVFRLVRLYDFAKAPSAFELSPPLGSHLLLSPTSYRASLI